MYRILIVEDDEIIARSLKKHLESWDYDVVCVEDFSDVMKEFAGAAPQLVLMDIKLPFFNGYHWCSSASCCHGVPDDQMDSGGIQPQQYRAVCPVRGGYGIGVPADLSAGVCADFPQLL